MAAGSSVCSAGWNEIAKMDAVVKHPHMPKQVLESFKSSKGIGVVVVDASALIDGGEKLMGCAEKLVTVKEVFDEVRDPASRQKMAFLPFTVQTLDPTEEALKKVINFSRATGDLQSLSDVDIKLLALTYTLEDQAHGIGHLRTQPPPLHVLKVRRLPERDLPGWGSNVPNIDEWEALERSTENVCDSSGVAESHILQLKTLPLNLSQSNVSGFSEDGQAEASVAGQAEAKYGENSVPRKPRRYRSRKREVKIEDRLMRVEGIDASKGEAKENIEDWQLAVCRSTRRRYLRRQARRAISQTSAKSDQIDVEEKQDEKMPLTEVSDELVKVESDGTCTEDASSNGTDQEELRDKSPVRDEEIDIEENDNHEKLGSDNVTECANGLANINIRGEEILEVREDMQEHMALDADHAGKACNPFLDKDDLCNESSAFKDGNLDYEDDEASIDSIDCMGNSSLTDGSLATTLLEDSTSEQSWMLRPFSNSSVACATNDFAMQNVLLQMGLRLLTPNGVQVHQLHRWVLKCHACNGVTAEVGRIFCPKCGNGGTLRKISVTVGENGIVQAGRRPRISIRGTRYSLPLPQGGREAITKNPILREDQLAHKLLYPKTKKLSGNRGINLLNSEEIGFQAKEKRAPLQAPVREAVAVFSGKRNPNDNRFSCRKH